MTKRQRIFAKTKGHCIYCGCKLPKRWHADHFLPVSRGVQLDRKNGQWEWVTGEMRIPERDTEENMVPSCPSCNIDKSDSSLEWWRHSLQHTTHTLQNQRAFKFAARFGLVELTGALVLFWFETDEGKEVVADEVLAMIERAKRLYPPPHPDLLAELYAADQGA